MAEKANGFAPEILAPVGGAEQLLAAVRCGADAVYLGGKGFNARRNASNFGETDLASAVSLCHGRGVKVYVTVNTLVMDSELRALEEEADAIAAAGADAVIIQDMAVAQLFAQKYPSIARHASTQTAVHNVEGAKFLQEQGFSCIVLARELSLDEMAKICAAVPVRMEAFVHGAHCVSLSGACTLSAMLGGRSGNRGLCAQPCRLDWKCGSKNYALSMKDMSLISHLDELAAVGVSSLKIEGRMKRPEYVAAAVTACRQARAGEPYDEQTLRAVFSRSGFTDGYLTAHRDASMFGNRTKEDVTGAEGVFKSLAALYSKETARVPVRMEFSLTPETAVLRVTDGEAHAVSAAAVPEKALNRPLDAASAEKNLTRTGGTPFFVQDFRAELAEGYLLPASSLNALRREALDALLSLRSQGQSHEAKPFSWETSARYGSTQTPALWARFARAEDITQEAAFARLLLPVSACSEALLARFGEKLTAQLPTLCFPEEEPRLEQSLRCLQSAGLQSVYANNISGIALAKRLGLRVFGGFGLNVLNTPALDFMARQGIEEQTLSFELPRAAVRALGGSLPRGLVAYGYLPLMHFRNCPVRAAIGCARCGGNGSLTDRRKVRFPVECGEQRYSTLLNSVPLDLSGQDMKNLTHLLLYFTRETPEEVARIAENFRSGRKTEAPHTGGLYSRELL